MKTYDPASDEVRARVAALIEDRYPDLRVSNAKIDLFFVWADGNQTPLSHVGYAAAAVVRALGDKDRVAGRGDAEIVIDREHYQMLKPAERDALLDHELYHLVVKKDRYGAIKSDEHRRPLLKMRKHTHQFGWFDEIAKRHGSAAAEVQQAREFMKQSGQIYLLFDEVKEQADLKETAGV